MSNIRKPTLAIVLAITTSCTDSAQQPFAEEKPVDTTEAAVEEQPQTEIRTDNGWVLYVRRPEVVEDEPGTAAGRTGEDLRGSLFFADGGCLAASTASPIDIEAMLVYSGDATVSFTSDTPPQLRIGDETWRIDPPQTVVFGGHLHSLDFLDAENQAPELFKAAQDCGLDHLLHFWNE